jgi:flagellar hook-length control protein FliK
MPNFAISPALTVPNSQGSDKILTTGTNNPEVSYKNSDFSKKLAKAVSSYPSATHKAASTAKEDIPDSNNRVNTPQNMKQDAKSIQPEKPELKSSKSSDSKASDSALDDQSNDQKASTLKDDSEQAQASDEKNSTTKNKDNKDNTEAAVTMVSPLAPVTASEPLVETQTGQTDNSSSGGSSVIDGGIAAKSSSATNVVDTGTKANAEDPIHNLNSGAAFFKELMSADDGKISPTALAGNTSELSTMPNSALQNGTGAVKDNSSTQATSTTSNASNTAPVSQVQNMVSQQVAISGNALQSSNPNQQVVGGQGKTKNSDDLKTAKPSDEKSMDMDIPLSVLKASDGTSPAPTNLKDASGAMLELNSKSSQPDSDGKGTALGDSLTTGQMTSKTVKGQTLNLPVIQTQLSVNNQSDKNRTDNVMALSVDQPHTVDPSTQVSTTTRTSEPINKDDLFAQIVEKAKVSLNHGNGEMEVNLKPDHLGKLHLKVSIENQLVTAKFVAESQQVKEIIETNLNQLRRNLQDNGIQVDQLMVSVGQNQNNGGFQNASHNSSGFAGQQSNPRAVSQEIPFKSTDNQAQRKGFSGQTAIDLIA